MSVTTNAYLGWLLLLGILTSGSMVKGTMSMMMIERSERENSAVQEFEPLYFFLLSVRSLSHELFQHLLSLWLDVVALLFSVWRGCFRSHPQHRSRWLI